jgi:hypothetical protein
MQQPAGVVVRPAIKHVPRSVVRDAHERIVRCGLGIVPVSSETEDKFEDAMDVMASSPLPGIARVLLRFNHVARRRPDTRKQADARVEQQRSRYRKLQRREHTKSE